MMSPKEFDDRVKRARETREANLARSIEHADEVREANEARKETGERVRWRISWGQLAILLICVVLVVVVAYFVLFHSHVSPNEPYRPIYP